MQTLYCLSHQGSLYIWALYGKSLHMSLKFWTFEDANVHSPVQSCKSVHISGIYCHVGASSTRGCAFVYSAIFWYLFLCIICVKSIINLLQYSRCLVSQSCLTFYHPMDCSTPGFPVLHHLLEFAQTHVHWVSDAIQSTSKCLEFAKLNPFFPIFFVSYSCTIFLWGDSESGSFARHKFQRYNKAKSPESQESIRGDRTKKKNLEII